MSASTASHQQSTTGSHMRLTRRGRVLVLALLVAVLFAAFSLGRSASQAASPAAQPAPAPHAVTVQAGESLWSMARRIAPDNDPREVVAQIRALNDLTTSHLTPGQQLLLPAAA
jgi:predicted Zn-dependent protease